MNKRIQIAAVLSLCMAFFVLGRWSNEHKWAGTPAVDAELPTIREVQKRIGCEKIDGKLSPDWRQSETQRKWDEYINNQYGVEACLKAGMR